MSQLAPITPSLGWHRFEHKNLEITVVDADGEPQTLTGIALSWKLLHHGTALITKTDQDGITLDTSDSVGAINDIAVIEIEETEYVYDEEDGTSEVPAGIYRHELWDTDSDVLLSYGDVHLLPGNAP